LTPIQNFGIKAAASFGALSGQLMFGVLSDILGRKRMCEYTDTRSHLDLIVLYRLSYLDGVELFIIITATFCQALAGSARAINIINVLIVWRFIVSVFSY
jgi:MFS transporter, PHS family, inorganic phosphate transporter